METAMTNNALLFIKPQAITPQAIAFVEDRLHQAGIQFKAAGEKDAAALRRDGTIDRHYFSISRAAMNIPPGETEVPAKGKAEFQKIFGRSIDSVINSGELINCTEAFERLGNPSPQTLNSLWRNGIEIKLGPGLYVSRLEESGLFVINGFYPSMKELFVAAGMRVKLYNLHFDPDALSWRDFRASVIGATDPDKAVPGSLRRQLRDNYRNLGLEAQPRTAFNGIHGSAGPIESLREFLVWRGTDPADQELGAALLKSGMSSGQLDALIENSHARFKEKQGPVFDITEDVDARDIPGNLAVSGE